MDIIDKKFRVKKIIYYNNANKWGVLAVVPMSPLGDLEYGLVNSYDNICVSGNFEGVYEECIMIISGNIITNPQYGKQIQIDRFKVLIDTKQKEGIVNFLTKSNIGGIAERNAMKIYDVFKEKSIDIVLNDTDKLLTIVGIGPKTVEKIKEGVAEYKKHQRLIDFCTNIGLSFSVINKLCEELGDEAISMIQEDPYKILEVIPGIGFRAVDEIYLARGGDPTSEGRLDKGFLYTLKMTATLEGSTGCLFSVVKRKFYDLLELQEAPKYCEKTIKRLLDKGKIEASENVLNGDSNGVIYYKYFLEIEKSISEKVALLNTLGTKYNISESIITEEINNFPFELNMQQKYAIKDCLKSTISVLTGSAGCGKSTITKALYRIYRKSGYQVILLSPTAKAARRLEECIGNGAEAQTLHKYLGIKKDEGVALEVSPESNTVFIIDEASMLDISLFNYLLNRVDTTSRVLLVGDNNQLPSVQAGNVLGDLISSGRVRVAILTDIMRQSEDSNIIKYCTMVNNGNIFDPCELSDFHYEEFGTAKELLEFFVSKYLQEVRENGLEEVQVITPYKKGEIGQNSLNKILQHQYNANGEVVLEPYRIGDRVRHIKNNYKKYVFNGETGIIVGMSEDGVMSVDYGDRIVRYKSFEVDELTLAYCSTVHASQGSEYKVCFIILDDTAVNDFLLIRRLLYTATSRGKQKVYILTKPYLVDKCIKNDSYRPRITKLKDFLKESSTSVYA